MKIIEDKVHEILQLPPVDGEMSLHRGLMGQIFLYTSSASHDETNAHADKIESSFLKIFEDINTNSIRPSFCGGLAGILWGMQHLKQRQFIDLDEDFSDVAPELKAAALHYAKTNNFDFLHGSDGIVFYLSSTDQLDQHFVNEWLELLHQDAHKKNDQFAWETVLDMESGKRGYNLSLSHGISSKIIVLAEVLKKFPGNSLAKNLLEGSVSYLLSHKKSHDSHSLFPSYVDGENTESRLSWCYGDLGNAIALWRAGNLHENASWKKEALDIMMHATGRKELKENNVLDAGFCHGASGIAHIFNRFYKETGIKEFDSARWYWLDQTLKMARFDDGLAGYKMWNSHENIFHHEAGLLEGTLGIGMVLLGFLTEDIEDLNWDRCFLLS